MSTQDHHDTATGGDDHNASEDQSASESNVPPVLAQLFECPVSERTAPQPLDVFPPTDWPSCPDCAERLIPAAVATDAHDELVAAAMNCYNSDHETRRYIYEIATETVYVDQVCAGPSPRSLDG
jgi:hypothetical protein